MNLTRTSAAVLLPTLTFVTVLLTGGADPLRAAARNAPKASLVGVMISSVVADAGEQFPLYAFQGTQQQTSLAFAVDDQGGGIVGYDREGSTVEVFADSTGKPLHDPDDPFQPFGFTERILNDGKRLVVELGGAEAPAAEARWVEARGSIAVRIAHEKATWRAERTPLAKGSEWIAGPYAFEVLKAGKSDWRDGFEIEVKTADPIQNIVEWALVDGDTRHALERNSTMSFNGTHHVTLHCEAAVEAGALELVAWRDPRDVSVPFSAKVRVGQE